MSRIPRFRRFVRIDRSPTRAPSADVDDELRFHLESLTDDFVAGGMGEHEARAAALREFGDMGAYRNDVLTIDQQFARDTLMREFFESVRNDLRHALRALHAQPGFTFVAVATLAIGIGATTSVFSAVSGVLLRPLPYPNGARIVHVGEQPVARAGRGGNTSFDNYTDWTRTSTSFAALGIVSNFTPILTDRGDPQRVTAALVSASMFDVFSVRPVLGRAVVPSDNLASADAVALLSSDFWRTRFGGDAAIVGQTITLNGAPVRVIGVLPPGFVGPDRLDRMMWGNFVPSTSDGRAGRSKEVYGLLRDSVTPQQAQAEMTRIAAQLATDYPKDDKGESIVVDPIGKRATADVERPLYMLLGASAFVLLIACANLSNLLLARGAGRRHELAVRAALGAAHGRIARQLLTESLLLATIGAVVGSGIALLMNKLLLLLGPPVFQRRPPELSIGVLMASIALSLTTALLFGLMPALRTAPRDPHATLRDGARIVSTRGTMRMALAVAQLSLAVIVLSASMLVVKSFVRVLRVEPGIRGDHLLTMNVTLPLARYDSLKSTIFYDQLVTRLGTTPGVVDASVTSLVPFGGSYDRVTISTIAGEPERAGADAPAADRYVVGRGYFRTMGIRLSRGRLLADVDRVDAPTAAVVDEVFARHAFGERDPIGRQIKVPGPSRTDFATIVGVVAHVKTYGLDVESPGQLYLTNEQFPWRSSSVVVRTTDDPMRFAPTLASAVHSLDPNQPAGGAATMEQLMSDLLRGRRFILTLLLAFGVAAIALAAIGLYGVVAYGVTHRRREFGIRMALGARRHEIARMIVLEGARFGAIGASIGLVGAIATTRFVGSFLFEVSARDTGVLAAVSLGLIVVAMMACLAPAYRATTVDAAEALRND